MFRYLRRALYRNRKKLLGTAVAVTAGGYLVKKKMGEYLERKMQQMKQAQLEMKQRNYHKDTVVVCEKAVTSLVRDLRNEIFSTLSIPSKQELQNTSKEEKLLSWDLFKMNSFARLITGTYGVCIFSMIARVLVVLVSRYTFMTEALQNGSDGFSSDGPPGSLGSDSFNAAKQATYNALFLSENVKHEFLAQQQYIIHTGIQHLINYIHRVLDSHLSKWSIAKKCTHKQLCALIVEIRQEIERGVRGEVFSGRDEQSSPEDDFSSSSSSSPSSSGPAFGGLVHMIELLLPPVGETPNRIDDKHQLLINETRDIFESENFLHVLQEIIDQCFDRVIIPGIKLPEDENVTIAKMTVSVSNCSTFALEDGSVMLDENGNIVGNTNSLLNEISNTPSVHHLLEFIAEVPPEIKQYFSSPSPISPLLSLI